MVDAIDLHGALPEDSGFIPEGGRLTALSPGGSALVPRSVW
jgi:hypothetical protein